MGHTTSPWSSGPPRSGHRHRPRAGHSAIAEWRPLLVQLTLMAISVALLIWLAVLLLGRDAPHAERLAYGPVQVLGAPVDASREVVGQRLPLIEGRNERDRPVLLDRGAPLVVVFARPDTTSGRQVDQLRRWSAAAGGAQVKTVVVLSGAGADEQPVAWLRERWRGELLLDSEAGEVAGAWAVEPPAALVVSADGTLVAHASEPLDDVAFAALVARATDASGRRAAG